MSSQTKLEQEEGFRQFTICEFIEPENYKTEKTMDGRTAYIRPYDIEKHKKLVNSLKEFQAFIKTKKEEIKKHEKQETEENE